MTDQPATLAADHPRARHLYVHVPYCARRCSYCDFAIAVRREVPWQAFARRVAAELAVREAGPWPEPMRTVYFGGGTPSRLGGEGVAAVWPAAGRRTPRSHWKPIPRT
jgi:oxygen-independent coproporphyrinogen-3 oxidase